MKIELINILITLVGYFGALYTKDIIQSIKKQKIIMRKLTSYNNQIVKDIIKNKDLSIMYCLLINKHIEGIDHHLENFEKYKEYVENFNKEKKALIVESKYILKNNAENQYKSFNNYSDEYYKETIELIKKAKENIINISDDEAGEISEYMCELVIELKNNVHILLNNLLIYASKIKSMKEFEFELIENDLEKFLSSIFEILETHSKINKSINNLNKRNYWGKIKDQVLKNTF